MKTNDCSVDVLNMAYNCIHRHAMWLKLYKLGIKVILYSYLILKKMNKRITDS